jgi:hypothetical protein
VERRYWASENSLCYIEHELTLHGGNEGSFVWTEDMSDPAGSMGRTTKRGRYTQRGNEIELHETQIKSPAGTKQTDSRSTGQFDGDDLMLGGTRFSRQD